MVHSHSHNQNKTELSSSFPLTCQNQFTSALRDFENKVKQGTMKSTEENMDTVLDNQGHHTDIKGLAW